MDNIMIPIVPGHYRKNNTFQSEHAQILRVWGEIKDKKGRPTGKWQTSEGPMSPYLIDAEYTFIQTAPTEEVANKIARKKSVLGLLEGLKEAKDLPQLQQTISENDGDDISKPANMPENLQPATMPKYGVENGSIIQKPHPKGESKNLLEDEIMSKCHSPKRTFPLSLNMSIEIPFDIKKLSGSIKLLTLNSKYIADKIAEMVFDNLTKGIIFNKILDELENYENNENDNDNVNVNQPDNKSITAEMKLLKALEDMQNNVNNIIDNG